MDALCQILNKNNLKIVEDFPHVIDVMAVVNIGIGAHYLSVSEQPYYQQTFGWQPENDPHALILGWQTESFPLSVKMIDDDAMDVAKAAKEIL